MLPQDTQPPYTPSPPPTKEDKIKEILIMIVVGLIVLFFAGGFNGLIHSGS